MAEASDSATPGGGDRPARPEQDSREELAPDEPSGFQQEHCLSLFLRYGGLNEEGEPTFRYFQEAIPADAVPPSKSGRDQTQWSPNLTKEELRAELHIFIKKDTLVTVHTDSGNDLFWSLESSAVKTREPRRGLYGQLRYWHPTGWKKRAQLDGDFLCRKIQFKAQRRHGNVEQSDKFSYNVRYRRDGALVEFEIDPDIRNPSV
jgi:hypothetical protein